MTKKKIVFWACDYSNKTGEGNLARKFVKDEYSNKNIKIKSFKPDHLLNYKYVTPFIGILYCWKYYLRGYICGYINYLPLWNFLIFLLLPPKTILGPITGGAFFNRTNYTNFLIRRFFFPIFYKFSEILINIRKNRNIIFSTNLLKKNLSKKTINKSKFNFIIKNFRFKKIKKKKIDFLIYYRAHKNKILLFNYDLIKKLINLKFKIFVVGDKLELNGVKNLGYIDKKRLNILQSQSKYTFYSGENIYSFFILECISNHVKILIDKKYSKQINFFKKFFIFLNKDNMYLKKLKKLNK